MQCLSCSRETTNAKFCSRSCSTRHNNLHRAPRLTNKCKECQAPIRAQRTYCWLCWQDKETAWGNISLTRIGDLQGPARERSARIRQHARYSKNRWDGVFHCEYGGVRLPGKYTCTYSLHLEVCHVRPVHSFPPEATLWEVNSSENLISLCRNHHWELDHGHISLVDPSGAPFQLGTSRLA